MSKYATVAPSAFWSQNVQSTPCSTLAICAFKKLHAIVVRSACRSQKVDSTSASDRFRTLRCSKNACRRGAAHFEAKSAKACRVRNVIGRSSVLTCGFCSGFNSDGRRGAFEEDLRRCNLHGRRNTRDICIIFAGQGADFLRQVAVWSIKSSALLR